MAVRITKKATTSHFKGMLKSSHAWAIKGLLAIYAHQTAEEQNSECTTEDNGVGFTGPDAEILSSFAKQVERKMDWVKSKGWAIDYTKQLSPKQFALLFKKMPKYAGQLIKISDPAKVEAIMSKALEPAQTANDAEAINANAEAKADLERPMPSPAIQIREWIRGECGDHEADQWYENLER